MKKTKKTRFWITAAFLLTELPLYWLILTEGGQVLVWSSFGSIVLCLCFALWRGKELDCQIRLGLAFTVTADFFLVVCSPIRRLEGMLCFAGAQTMYSLMMHRGGALKGLLKLRLCLILLGLGATLVVLGNKADLLSLASVYYYVNLIMNIVCGFCREKKDLLLPLGFVLLLLCDTVIGLQVASGGYLPIAEGSLLHRIIFMPFNLAWFFYLPSQMLLALSGKRQK